MVAPRASNCSAICTASSLHKSVGLRLVIEPRYTQACGASLPSR
jgi:hypothetical protein